MTATPDTTSGDDSDLARCIRLDITGTIPDDYTIEGSIILLKVRNGQGEIRYRNLWDPSTPKVEQLGMVAAALRDAERRSDEHSKPISDPLRDRL